MNYEEKYKQAVEAAKRELHCCGSLDCDAARQIFRVFPELRESEDEKIRKEIIQSIKDSMCVIHKDKCLAWLEKQKDTNVLIQEASEKAYTEGMRVERKHWLERQGEQKPDEWSEEDVLKDLPKWKKGTPPSATTLYVIRKGYYLPIKEVDELFETLPKEE